jgi:hypothetical protein
VQVHHRQHIEHVRTDQFPEGHHHAQIGPNGEHVVDLMTHGDTQRLGGGLHRRG